jgi:formylglycine-generating enzyme required for sulfatase activity
MSEATENSVGMQFVLIPSGTFVMGGDPVSEQADENENPRHKVTFPSALYIGKFTVTQSQWQEIMGTNPSHFPGQNGR